jgi:hypothetical protein
VSAPTFDLAEHRRERNAHLERENERLHGERIRLERLLALALQVATGGTTVAPTSLLGVLCELAGTNPARPAYVERRERQEAETRMERVVQVLRETA